MANVIPDWLKAICREEHIHIGKVMALDVNGERWVFATDGHMLAAIRSEAEAAECYAAEFEEEIRDYLTLPTPHRVTMADLRKTKPEVLGPKECGKCEDGTVTCTTCKGSGAVPGDAPCAECGCTDDECDDCEGEGKTKCCCSCRPEQHPHLVAIDNSVVFNARFLWQALAHLEGDTVRIGFGGARDPITFATDSWRIVVMPTVDELTEAKVHLRIVSAESEVSP